VAGGATNDIHSAASYPAMPDSATVGTSGNAAIRVLPLVTSARNCPARMLGSDGAMVANCMSSRPVIISVMDCAAAALRLSGQLAPRPRATRLSSASAAARPRPGSTMGRERATNIAHSEGRRLLFVLPFRCERGPVRGLAPRAAPGYIIPLGVPSD
jgi:hypothetical protein